MQHNATVMIEVKPSVDNYFVCPECKSEGPAVKDVLIRSVHIMADCTCNKCGLQFYQVFPVGHHVEDQISVGKQDSKFYRGDHSESWLFDSVVRSHEELKGDEVKIEKIVFRECADVVILNTLDYLYGHVLLKLYNAFYHLDRQQHLGLVLIIPRIFEWLIPKGCAEAWVVDLKLNELAYSHDAIQKFVSQQFQRFDSIYLSRAYSHPDVTTIDISRLTGVKPFDLKTFRGRNPVITFILREDRWWLSSIADYWFFRACRKLKILAWGGRMLAHRQNKLVKKAIRQIRKRLPAAEFYIAGLGQTGSFYGHAMDERETKVDVTAEIAWCKIYASSHVVIGVHGSNMLLPTALAAGCVEILPEERYGNMVQDISVRYHDRRQLFFYRFADQYSSSHSVALKVVAMIEHYDMYHKNMCLNTYGS